MKKLTTTVLAAAAALFLTTAAQAATVLGGLDWDTSNVATLTLTPVVPGGNQPTNLPCVICGANQPQQPALLGYNNFGNQGNLTNLLFFSTSVVGGSLGVDTYGGVASGYTIGAGSPLLNALGGNVSFSVGIDSNQSGGNTQVLESFYFLNFTTQTVLAAFIGPAGIDPPNNGTGFPDYTLTGLTLAGISAGDRVGFFARISNANDGPDSFFLIPSPSVSEVPIPGAVWLFASGLGGLGYLMRKRRQKQQQSDDLTTPAAA
jgi:hypothetical protein